MLTRMIVAHARGNQQGLLHADAAGGFTTRIIFALNGIDDVVEKQSHEQGGYGRKEKPQHHHEAGHNGKPENPAKGGVEPVPVEILYIFGPGKPDRGDHCREENSGYASAHEKDPAKRRVGHLFKCLQECSCNHWLVLPLKTPPQFFAITASFNSPRPVIWETPTGISSNLPHRSRQIKSGDLPAVPFLLCLGGGCPYTFASAL